MAESTIPDERVMDVLRASGNFGSLDETVLQNLCCLLDVKTVPGGHVVYREGDPAHTMFFLISGRLRVSCRGAGGELHLYNEIRPRESVGEAGVILQQPRAADITALRDSTVTMLSRADFERLLKLHPLPMNQVFVRAIYHHFRHASQTIERRHAQIFVVVPLHGDAQAHAVSASLTQAFSRIGRAHHVMPQAGQSGNPDATGAWQGKDRFDELESRYDYLIYEVDERPGGWTGRAFRQSDQVIFVARLLERLSVRSALRGMFRWGRSGQPGIGDILYRASHIGGLRQRPRTIALSDHHLEPPVAAFALMAYGRARRLAAVGYRYAMQEIAAWGRGAGAAT